MDVVNLRFELERSPCMLSRDQKRKMLTSLGERIRRLRRERALTQKELAAAARLSVAYVSLLERGLRNPAFSTLSRLARALRVSAGDLSAE